MNKRINLNLFKNILVKNQTELKAYMEKKLRGIGYNPIVSDGFIYAQGKFPVLIVAHMDTVHESVPKTIYLDKELGILSSPQGIGGDDRCGCYMMLQVAKKMNVSVLLTEDEEVGGIGADKFVKKMKKLGVEFDFNYIIEFDRMNANDAVFYSCNNQEFTDFICKDFYKEAFGTYSDICDIGPAFETASVNLSCGYYKAHTKDEYIVINEMQESIEQAIKILQRTNIDTDKFIHIEEETPYYSKYFDDYEYDDKYWWIEYTDEENSINCEYVTACSQEEAVGKFLIDNPGLCFRDINAIYEDAVYGKENYYERGDYRNGWYM